MEKPKSNKRKRSDVEADSKDAVKANVDTKDIKEGSLDDVEMASEGKDEEGTGEDEDEVDDDEEDEEEETATGVKSLSTFERAKNITFDGTSCSQPSPPHLSCKTRH